MSSLLDLGDCFRARLPAACTSTFARSTSTNTILTSTGADSLVGALNLLRWVLSLGRVVTLCAVSATALPWSTAANTLLTTTAAGGLSWLTCNSVWFLLVLLQICKSSCFVVNIGDLLLSFNVESTELLASGSFHGFLKVGVETTPCVPGLVGNLVLVVHRLGLVGHSIFRVEVLQGGCELVAITLLFVNVDGLLNNVIRDGVSVSEIFGDDSRSWLILLWDVIVTNSSSGCGRGAGLLCDLIDV